MGDLDELADLTAELYALPPEDFVAVRTARAKQARADGDGGLARRVAELPKPTMAAWLLNQLVRRRPQEVATLVELGDQLRGAQRTLAGGALRALGKQRHAVVAAFARQVADLADELERPLSAAVAHQVEETLRAAVADADAGRALLSGRLTAALSYVGMGEVDVSSAVVVPFARPGRTDSADAAEHDNEADESVATHRRQQDAARRVLAEAEDAAGRAVDDLDGYEQRVRELGAAAAELRTRVDALRAALTDATGQATGADAQLQEAESARDSAARAAADARRAVEDARAEVAALG